MEDLSQHAQQLLRNLKFKVTLSQTFKKHSDSNCTRKERVGCKMLLRNNESKKKTVESQVRGCCDVNLVTRGEI